MGYWELIRLLGSAWPVMLSALFFGWGTVVSGTGLMVLSAYLISAAALHPSAAELSSVIVGVRFFGLARAACRYAERYISHDATFRLLESVRVRCYQGLEALPWSRFLARDRADWLTTVVEDVEILKEFYLRSLLPLGISLAVLGPVCYFLWPIAWQLPALIAAAFLSAGLLLPWLTKQRQKKVAADLSLERLRLREQVLETVLGMESLWAANRCQERQNLLEHASRRLIEAQSHAAKILVRGESCGNLLLQLTFFLLLVLGILLVEQGRLAGVHLAPLVLGVQSAFEAVLLLPAAVYYLAESLTAWRRLRGLLHVSQAKTADAAPQGTRAEKVSVNALSYRHGPDEAGIEEISFFLEPGRRVAIVGASGSGKTTLLNVLLGFLPKEAGTIFLDGRSVAMLPLESVSLVPQAGHLFQASLEDNIRLAEPKADAAAVDAAAAAAQLSEVAAALPQGMKTLVGAQGKSLSGGERQRVALARSFLKKAPFLIWDEATVGLDALLEEKVLAALDEAQRTCGVLLITHRLTVGLKEADEIILLERGRVAERGSMQELLGRNSLFRQMWLQQRDTLQLDLMR